MKKLFIPLIAVVCAAVAVFLSSCGNEKAENQSSVAETTMVTQTEVTTEEATTEEITTQPPTESPTTYEEYLHPTTPDGQPMAQLGEQTSFYSPAEN